jgi:hypothetical protein
MTKVPSNKKAKQQQTSIEPHTQTWMQNAKHSSQKSRNKTTFVVDTRNTTAKKPEAQHSSSVRE